MPPKQLPPKPSVSKEIQNIEETAREEARRERQEAKERAQKLAEEAKEAPTPSRERSSSAPAEPALPAASEEEINNPENPETKKPEETGVQENKRAKTSDQGEYTRKFKTAKYDPFEIENQKPHITVASRIKKNAEEKFFTPDAGIDDSLQIGRGILFAKKQYDDLISGLDRAFAIEFQQFLQGNSRWNIMKRGDGVTPVVPWGIRSLWHIDGVTPYLNSFMDKRMEYQKKLAHLYLRGPTTLNEAYLYFKFIVCDGVLDGDEASMGFLDAYNADFPMTQEFRDVQAETEPNPFLPSNYKIALRRQDPAQVIPYLSNPYESVIKSIKQPYTDNVEEALYLAPMFTALVENLDEKQISDIGTILNDEIGKQIQKLRDQQIRSFDAEHQAELELQTIDLEKKQEARIHYQKLQNDILANKWRLEQNKIHPEVKGKEAEIQKIDSLIKTLDEQYKAYEDLKKDKDAEIAHQQQVVKEAQVKANDEIEMNIKKAKADAEAGGQISLEGLPKKAQSELKAWYGYLNSVAEMTEEEYQKMSNGIEKKLEESNASIKKANKDLKDLRSKFRDPPSDVKGKVELEENIENVENAKVIIRTGINALDQLKNMLLKKKIKPKEAPKEDDEDNF